MSVEIIRGKPDKYTRAFKKCLEHYVAVHPKAKVEIYRQNPAMVRIRVIDPIFEGQGFWDRDEEVWSLLRQLPLDTQNELGTLTLVAPSEIETSPASIDFDNPIPSTFV